MFPPEPRIWYGIYSFNYGTIVWIIMMALLLLIVSSRRRGRSLFNETEVRMDVYLRILGANGGYWRIEFA